MNFCTSYPDGDSNPRPSVPNAETLTTMHTTDFHVIYVNSYRLYMTYDIIITSTLRSQSYDRELGT
jgi:hypothetical protein